MTIELKKIFLIGILIFCIKGNFYSQLTATSATACPNQSVVITASWNNVTINTCTITRAASTPTPQNSPSFTVVDTGPGASIVVYTIVASGTSISGAVSGTTTATLTIQPPAPLSIVQTASLSNYCYNSTAFFSAPSGSSFTYSITGPGTPLTTSNNNLLQLNGLTPAFTGIYTVTANYGGCIKTGTTQIYVSPDLNITITPSINVCQGTATAPGTVFLNASLPSAVGNYTWTGGNYNQSPSPQNLTLTPVTLTTSANDYKVTATFSFNPAGVGNTAICTRTAGTAIAVVPTSTIAISASPSKTLCQGANLNLVANITSGSAGWAWTGPNAFTSAQQNPVISNVVPSNSGNYFVTAYFVGAALTCTTGASVNFSVVGTVVPNVSAPANVCQGGTAQLIASANGAIGFSWIGPAGYTSNQASPVITPVLPSASGDYYATAHFAIGTVPCVKSRSVALNVVPINTISVLPLPDVCIPDNAYFQASAIGASSFTWTGPAGPIGYVPVLTLYHPSVSESGIYTITADFGGTSGLFCPNTNTVSLIVKPLLNFTLSPAQLVCYNSTIHLDGPAGATGYTWTSASGYESNNQNVDIPSVQTSNTGNYYLTVSLNGCITSGTTSIDVISPIQFTQPFFDMTVCSGDTIYLEAPVEGGSENYAYTWDPGAYLSAITGSSTIGVPLGSIVYNVLVHDIVCPENVLSGAVGVTVNQPPVPQLELTASEGCAPFCQYYDSKTGNQALWVTYDFGPHMKYQQDGFTHCLTEPGTYNLQISVTGTNGCSATYPYQLPIVVDAKPALSIVTDPESPTITDQIVFSAATNYSFSSYSWIFTVPDDISASDTSMSVNPVKSFTNAGTYPVFLTGTTDLGCADTVVRYVEIREDFNVFIPNSFTPNDDNVNDIFQIKGSGISADHFDMELIDRKGHVLFSTTDINAGWDGKSHGVKVQQDVYVYKITLQGGHSEGKKQYIGQFTLLR